jgi:ribosomal protein S18 acetylase RimI-like enzyme
MIIRKASKKDKVEAINLAEGLPEWFDRVGMESLRVDLEMNHLVVAVEKNEIVGFSCYSSYGGRMILMWFGVKKEYHRKGIGKKLLDWIEEESKKLKLNYIELETLPEE